MVSGLLGQASSAAGTNISLPKIVKVNVGFGGTVMKPTIKTGMKNGATSTVKEELVNTVKDKANDEAQKILTDAQAQVDKIKAETQVTTAYLPAAAELLALASSKILLQRASDSSNTFCAFLSTSFLAISAAFLAAILAKAFPAWSTKASACAYPSAFNLSTVT